MRGVMRKSLNMAMPMGMQTQAVSRQLGVEFAGIIQRPHRKRVNIYIIFKSLSLHTIGMSIAKPSLACVHRVQLYLAALPRNISSAKRWNDQVFQAGA
jgi:hypothetical protein